jgi:hypothetical protein
MLLVAGTGDAGKGVDSLKVAAARQRRYHARGGEIGLNKENPRCSWLIF